MSLSGYGLNNYQDIASAAMGGYAGMTAPTYQQAGLDTQKKIMWSEYNRDQLRRDKTRADISTNLAEERAYRALPGQFNQRGMLDSGQYQRGGRELASAFMRGRQMADEDYMKQVELSHLGDAMALGDLEGLKGQLTPKQYQTLVSALVRGAGGAA